MSVEKTDKTRAPGRPRGTMKHVSPLLKRYEEQIKTELRVKLAEKNLRLDRIAWELEKAGMKETAKGLSAKLNAGTFSAAYYLALKDIIDAL